MNKLLFFLNVVIITAIATIVAVNAWNSPNNNPPSSTNQAMYINSSNNVGIGTTAPGAKLDIVGNIKIADGTQGAGKKLVSNSSGLASWQGFMGALVYKSASQSIPSNSVAVLIFNLENYDTSNIHDPIAINSRLVVPAGVSRVKLSARVYWENPVVGGASLRSVNIRKNGGSSVSGVSGPSSADSTVTIQETHTPVLNVVPGDYFEVIVVHNYGSNINIAGFDLSTTWFAMEIIE